MKIEDRLHDAMHGYAETIEPEPDSWQQITARLDGEPAQRRPSRRPLVLAGVAIALVVVLITALAIRDDGGGTRVVTGPAGVAAVPSRILAITVADQPVVLEAESSLRVGGFGTTSRIAEGTRVAVTPDGQDAYLVQGDGNEGCADTSILRLPLDPGTGAGETVAERATEPAVSPDGAQLAYLRCLPGDARADEIVLRDLATGEERTTAAPNGAFFIALVGFAPDSRHVLYGLYEDASGRDTRRELDLVGGEAAPGREVPIDDAIFVLGYLGSTGELLGLDARSNPARVVALSSVTGAAVRTLLTTEALPSPPAHVASDASGRHLLLQADGGLYRWSEGEEQPTKLVGNYRNGVWVPDDAPAEEPPAAASLPTGVLVAGRDGRLAVLGAQDGGEHRSLGTFVGATSPSATPDGREIYFQSTTADPGCDQGPGQDVIKLVPATGTTSLFVGAADSPQVSPDGKWVAFGTWCGVPTTLGFTNTATGGHSLTNPLGDREREADPSVESVEPLGWSPDSTRVLYRLGLKGDEDPHYYVGRVWPVVPQAETEVIELPGGGDITAAAFIDDETVALAMASDNGSEVRSWSIAASSVDRRSPPLVEFFPGRVTSMVADRSGRHFLAVNHFGALLRWSRGDELPTKLIGDVAAATWLPWS